MSKKSIVKKKVAESKPKPLPVDDKVLSMLFRTGLQLPNDKTSGLVILIRGKPGTGKSTLALQLLDLLNCGAQKKYLTLEQSTFDLNHKLNLMRVSRALDYAQATNYETPETFNYDVSRFVEILGSLDAQSRKNCEKRIKKYNSNKSNLLPIYGEPNPDQRDATSDLQDDLTALLTIRDEEGNKRSVWSDEISMLDRAAEGGQHGDEGPLRSAGNRLIQALHLLGPIFQNESHVDRTARPLFVVDGLSLFSTAEREAFELQRLVDELRRYCQVGILVYEPNADETTSLDHQADMVIQLSTRNIEKPLAYLIYELQIVKARYQEAALGSHQFKIRGSGLKIFPSLHFHVHHYNYMELELKRSSGEMWKPPMLPEEVESQQIPEETSLIDMVSNPQDGESVVLLGSRNSFKTQLCLDFLARGDWGCPIENASDESVKHKDDVGEGLLISLIDNAPTIERGLFCPWRKSRFGFEACEKCQLFSLKNSRAFCQRPGCITPSEFFYYLRERIDRVQEPENLSWGRRVVFWDLTQMDYRFPLFRADKMLLPAMMDMFKTTGFRSLFMGAGNAENTPGASAMADHVLFCWRSGFVPTDISGKADTASAKKKTASAKKKTASAKEGEPWADKDAATGVSSLMLYVDRASAAAGRSGKALYCIPVNKKDKLWIPTSQEILERTCRISIRLVRESSERDAEEIDRITRMQGVQ